MRPFVSDTFTYVVFLVPKSTFSVTHHIQNKAAIFFFFFYSVTSWSAKCQIVRFFFFFESCFTLVYCWQYSVISWSVTFGSFCSLFRILCRISASFAETNPWTKIKNLELSPLNFVSLKSLQCLLTTAAKVVKSCSFLTKLRHFHLLWNSDVLRENSYVKMFTVSVNLSSQKQQMTDFFLFLWKKKGSCYS